MQIKTKIDWASPDYTNVFQERAKALKWLKENPGSVVNLKKFYKERWAQFISDWMFTYDPRLINKGQPPVVPFILFPKQVECIEWLRERWLARERGLVDKSRDMGVSWLITACSVCVWLFYEYANIGFGSRKAELVDNGDGDSDSLFWKIRKLIELLPAEFSPKGYGEGNKLRVVVNPENKSVIKGEQGDDIGRGSRTTLYFVDEADALEHQLLAESSLAGTTDCRIDVSTQNQVGSVFYENRRSLPEKQIFVFDWKDDPRKRRNLDLVPEEEPWYLEQRRNLRPSVVASQIDRNPAGAIANAFIPLELIEEAEQRTVSSVSQGPSVGWRIGVDAAGFGNDEIVVWQRRGRVNLPPLPLPKMDGVVLAAKVQEIVKNLLKIAPVELIAIERDGPGGSCADQLLHGPFASIVKAVHTGRKLKDGKHYNFRAWLHTQAKGYLEESEPYLPRDPTFKVQATAILLNPPKKGLMLVEGKEEYRARLSGATSRVGKLAGRSPDRWDSFVLTFVPTTASPIKKLTDSTFMPQMEWRPLDRMMGY